MGCTVNKCDFCKVYIKDKTTRCPLCGGVLIGQEEGENTYPDVYGKNRAMKLVFRLLVFLGIVASTICVYVDYHDTLKYNWSIIVIGAIVFGLGFLSMFLKENMGYRARTFVAAVAVVIYSVLVEYVIGYEGWALSFIMPGVFLFIDIALLVLICVNSRNWASYIIIMAAMSVLSIFPFVMALRGIAWMPLLCYISCAVTVFLFLGVVIIGGKESWTELKRRFHVR